MHGQARLERVHSIVSKLHTRVSLRWIDSLGVSYSKIPKVPPSGLNCACVRVYTGEPARPYKAFGCVEPIDVDV